MDGSVRKSLPLGAGIGLCPLSWQTLAGLYPDSLAGSGRFCVVLVCALRAQTYRFAAALTLRIDLAARVPSRAVERLISPTHRTFGPSVRHRFNGVAMAELASGLLSEAVRFPDADLAGRPSERAPLTVCRRGSAATVSSGSLRNVTHHVCGVTVRFGLSASRLTAGSVEGFPSTTPSLAAAEVLNGAAPSRNTRA